MYCYKSRFRGYSKYLESKVWITSDSNLIKRKNFCSFRLSVQAPPRHSFFQRFAWKNGGSGRTRIFDLRCIRAAFSPTELLTQRLDTFKKRYSDSLFGFDRHRVIGILYKGGDPAAPSGTATLLWLNPNHQPHRRRRPLTLNYRLWVKSTLMVWQAVCTRPGNVFTAAFWSAITSDSSFMPSSCRGQSELRWFLRIGFALRHCDPLLPPL